MLERASLTDSIVQMGVHKWAETWESIRGVIFIVTDFATGERTVYVGDEADDLRQELGVNFDAGKATVADE